jgi:hypothetical protein
MTRSAARRVAPVALAVALLAAGCGSDGSNDASTAGSSSSSSVGSTAMPGGATASAAVCAQYAALKTDAASLGATPIDTSGTPEEIQQQVDALQGKADKVHDDLATLQMESNGGPADAAIGAFNEKADALRAQLTVAKADAQEDLGPKITAAEAEVKSAYTSFEALMGGLCPMN